MKTALNFLRFFPALAVVALIALMPACAATSQNKGNLMVSAGFNIVPCITPGQQNYLKTLTPGKITVVTKNGKTHYIYPDPVNSQIYMGGPQEYQAYKQLRTEQKQYVEIEEQGDATTGPWGDGWVSI